MKSSKIAETTGVWINCPSSGCGYSWNYTGRFFLYATCPSCRRNVRIQDNKIGSPQSVRVGRPSQIAAGTPAEADALR
jgi:hypothetical protein